MSHVYPKGHYPRMEYDSKNLKLLCRSCHNLWHAEPYFMQSWFERRFPDRVAYLKERSNVTGGPLPSYEKLKKLLEEEICSLHFLQQSQK